MATKTRLLNMGCIAIRQAVLLHGLLFCFCTGMLQPVIQINQVGYNTAAEKQAIIMYPGNDLNFTVVDAFSGESVLKGTLSEAFQSRFSSTTTRIADFSAITRAGVYKIQLGAKQSIPFSINKNIFNHLSQAVIKGFYYQRVSVPLDVQYAGDWHRPAGHKDDSVVVHASAASTTRQAGTVIASPGGWYDAGDYNKYIVNSGITMYSLLAAYEDFPAYYARLNLNIPESDNEVPDILDEVLCNLRWMFTMQDPSDGGVYHKCTNAKFDSVVMPGITRATRYVVRKSTAATLDFAAVMAQANRVYAPFKKQLPGLADSCLQAALSAWQWSINHPAVVYNQEEMNQQFSPPITTGAYGDKYLKDEWFWAAVELTVTTNDKKYIQSRNVDPDVKPNIPSWSRVDMLGIYTILKHKQTFAGTKPDVEKLQKDMVLYADQLTAGGNKAFNSVMGQSERDFVWGSNAVAMNQSMLLLKTFLLTQSKKYLQAANSNLDYVLGRNATGYCFVTGFGNKYPMHIHHRPSQADGVKVPVPGLLAGGPNPGRQDKCVYVFTETETSYTDQEGAYASNEIAINWNAPLVYVTGAVDASQ